MDEPIYPWWSAVLDLVQGKRRIRPHGCAVSMRANNLQRQAAMDATRPTRTASRGRPQRFIDRELQYRRVRRVRDAALLTAERHERRLGHSLRLATLVFIQYALLAADIRFVSSANYYGIAAVNVCIAINTWYLTRGIIEARTRIDRLCFVVGGTAGALIAVLAT